MELLKRCIVLVLVFGILNCQINGLKNNGICNKNKSFEFEGDNYVHNRVFCCSNYEEKNGKCEACSVGYTSEAGSSCKACPAGRYGEKCSMECHCTEKESCNHAKGCQLTETNTDSRCSDGYTTYDELSCKPCKENRYGKKCLQICDCNNHHRCDNVAGCVMSGAKTVTINHERSDFPVEYIVAFATCSLIPTVIISIVVFVCYKRKRTRSGDTSNDLNQQQSVNQNNPDRSGNEHQDITNHYEEIDENYLCPDLSIPNVGTQNNADGEDDVEKDAETKSNDLKTMNEGYLNPYQPVKGEVETHHYKSITKETDSDFSDCEAKVRDSGYLNPYQPLTQEKKDEDIEKYSILNQDENTSLNLS